MLAEKDAPEAWLTRMKCSYLSRGIRGKGPTPARAQGIYRPHELQELLVAGAREQFPELTRVVINLAGLPLGGFRSLAMVSLRPFTGTFEARLESGPLLCRSHQPFLESARRLLDAGHSPSAILVMRHLGSRTAVLRGQLRSVARLTVAEDRSAPGLRPWKARPLREGWSPIASIDWRAQAARP